jgi:hypothetical protein
VRCRASKIQISIVEEEEKLDEFMSKMSLELVNLGVTFVEIQTVGSYLKENLKEEAI